MTTPRRRSSIDTATAALLALMALGCILFAWGKGFGVDGLRAVPAATMLYGLALARALARERGRPLAEAVATAFLQMTGFTLLGVVLAYAIAAHPAPLWDARLAAIDRALGFDWPVILATLDRSPVLIALLGVAYHSLSVQMMVAILLLGIGGRIQTLRLTVCAAVLSGFATILVSAAMPAMGNLFDPGRYAHLWPSIAWVERDLIAGLRDGTGRVLDLSMPMGIVSFPSFHATLSALFTWSARDTGRACWPLRLWAALTIVATPVFGGHYAVEVIAGLLLAPPAIAAAQLFARPETWIKRRAAPFRWSASPGSSSISAASSCGAGRWRRPCSPSPSC